MIILYFVYTHDLHTMLYVHLYHMQYTHIYRHVQVYVYIHGLFSLKLSMRSPMWHPSYTQLATVKPWSMWWSIAQADLAFRAVGWRGHVCEAYITYVSRMIYVPCLVLEYYLEEAGSGVTFAHKLVSKIFGGPQKIPQRIRRFDITNCITHLAVACCPPTEGPTCVRWRPSDLVGQFSTSIWAKEPKRMGPARVTICRHKLRQWVCLCGYNRVARCCWIIASVKTWWLVYIWCIWRWLIILQCLRWF